MAVIEQHTIFVIGGSAGSFPLIIDTVKAIRQPLAHPVIIILHRLKNVESSMVEILNKAGNGLIVKEPEDKELVLPGYIYLAPQNYHLLVDDTNSFCLDYSEPVNFSRPSIDVCFKSVAAVYGVGCTGILLSGANKDGAEGLKNITQKGGIGIVQDPLQSDYPAMPEAALQLNKKLLTMRPEQIIKYLMTNLSIA